MTISVIIPVFNAKDRLMPLITNLFSQNGADRFEFIFVDDHSSDESYQILECAASVYGNIRLFRMEKNSGPAATRNLGIEHATGDYLCFVDDDDTLGESYGFIDKRFSYIPELKYKFFENALPLLGENDIILCRRVVIEKDEDKISHCESPNDSSREGEFSQSYHRALYMHGMQYICGCFFRRELIDQHHIRFIPDLEPNEDLFFGILAGYHAKTVATSYDSVYGYHSRSDSLSRREGENARLHDLHRYCNRQMPLLLSYLLLKDAKYMELCQFVYGFRNTMRRMAPYLFMLGEEFHQYSFVGAFPEMCFTCEHIKEVCNGNASCPNTAEFMQFIKDAAKKFLPENFDWDLIIDEQWKHTSNN